VYDGSDPVLVAFTTELSGTAAANGMQWKYALCCYFAAQHHIFPDDPAMSPSKQQQLHDPSNIRLIGAARRTEIGAVDYIPDEPFMPVPATQRRRQQMIDTTAEHMTISLLDGVIRETAACALLITRAAVAADACTSAIIDSTLLTSVVTPV
jgi:hypothetical protein